MRQEGWNNGKKYCRKNKEENWSVYADLHRTADRSSVWVVIHYWIPSSYIKDTVIVEGVLYVVGQGFIRLMQMLVVPLVFCSLICGSMAIGDTKTLGKVGVKTIGFYLVTTALAVCVPLGSALLINPAGVLIWMLFRKEPYLPLQKPPVWWILC